jgi:hypothetical protein
MSFTVEFDDKGKMIRAINTGVDGVTSTSAKEALPSSKGKCANQLRNHKMKNINSVAILTTENPHIVIYQGGKYIVLPH